MEKLSFSFTYTNFLRVNKKFLEIDTINPEEFNDILTLATGSIQRQFEMLHPGATILIMRLGQLGLEDTVLSGRGMQNGTSIHTAMNELQQHVQPYWLAIDASPAFKPEVRSHFEGGGPAIDGTWLGVKPKNI